MTALDLTYCATGAWQHVFVRTGEENDWVYKIPAAFGHILPFDHPLRTLREGEHLARALQFALLRMPRWLTERVRTALASRDGWEQSGKFQRTWTATRSLLGYPQALGRVLLTSYLRKSRLRHFDRMLDMIDYLADRHLAELLLPCTPVRSVAALLRAFDTVMNYEGPMLVQRKADLLLEQDGRFHSLDWREMTRVQWNIAASQHLLWRHGIAVVSRRGMFGLRGWACLGRHVHLCDTSGLTADFRTPWSLLAPSELERLEALVLQHARFQDQRAAGDYFRFMRSEISRSRLVQLWRLDVGRRHH